MSSREITGTLPISLVGHRVDTPRRAAGMFVYVRKTMIHSLGGGYALGVSIGRTPAQGFTPTSHD
jgi:hypothetical protein